MRNMYAVAKAVLRGTYYLLLHRVISRNVVIRFPFMAYAPVRIKGKGSVLIDKGCSVFYSKHAGLTIHTLNGHAKVSIGKGCDLAGMTIRCGSSVTIGDRTMTAFSLVQDEIIVDTHGKNPKPRDFEVSSRKDIVIGSYVWLCGQSCVLAGTFIGDGCVLSANSSVFDVSTKSDCLLVGSPIRRGLPINGLIK